MLNEHKDRGVVTVIYIAWKLVARQSVSCGLGGEKMIGLPWMPSLMAVSWLSLSGKARGVARGGVGPTGGESLCAALSLVVTMYPTPTVGVTLRRLREPSKTRPRSLFLSVVRCEVAYTETR